MENTDLNALRDRAYKIACEHGFHDKELSNEHFLMLVITELSEAVEADRKGKRADIGQFNSDKLLEPESLNNDLPFIRAFEKNIKDSVADELADAVIRLLDLAGLRKQDCHIEEVCINMACNSCERESFSESVFAICKLCFGDFDDYLIKDIICNILGLAKFLNIDLFWHIEQKMKYNELREKMHGKKY